MTTAQPTPEMRVCYVGACALLARLSRRKDMSEDDLECIGRALDDCSRLTGTVVVEYPRGYALEPGGAS